MTYNEDTDRCGEPKPDGKPCKRPAGWGTENDSGPCADHRNERRALRKFNDQTRERILGAAQQGAFKIHCAQVAGITEQTLRNWLEWGERDLENGFDTELSQFHLDFHRARGAGAVKRLSNARDEFVLERSYGYTKREEIEHSGTINASEAYAEILKQSRADGDESDTSTEP